MGREFALCKRINLLRIIMWENDICLCSSTDCEKYDNCKRGEGIKRVGIYTQSLLGEYCNKSNNYPEFIPTNKVKSESKILRHSNLCSDIHSTYVAKNKDYGDSFGASVKKYGIISALTRMSDKWNRLENLIINNQDNNVKDENIKDTLLDLANYCIMTVMELEDMNE